tara:strand:+ start:374 stop:721 length:348 start_codon:yes stop_codon:yes gene_type:complete
MLTIESVVTFSGLVVGFGIVFLWGVRIGRNLQYKEVQKVTQFLSILKDRGIFQSEESITAAYTVAEWLSGRLEDIRETGPYEVWPEKEVSCAEENANEDLCESGTIVVSADSTNV